ncbi:Platinum sensitivity protein [Linnemannia exigua]|uniref:Platinum sensitivity protein n=1 Tax=Linnemannia exigua TaxID=604196 RepID=A0AAD4DEA2_9FUNG|nr:Platinum sensitivity protein [Linnemannia exigua]
MTEPDGYSDVWSALHSLPQNNYETETSEETGPFTSGIFNAPEDEPSTPLLPNPSISNLNEIGSILTSMGTDEEEQLIEFIVVEGYIDKLVSVLKTCEDSDLNSNLHNLRAILVHLIELGDLNIMEEVVRDETFVGCIGILEYEPDLLDEKSHYRTIYTQRANFKQIVAFNDPQVEVLVHQVFRLQFLRDVVLFRHMEEVSRTLLETILNRKTTRIVQKLLGDRQFLLDIFDIVEDVSQPVERRQDVVLFMHQFCTMAKKTNGAIYRRLGAFGLFNLLELAFAAENDRVKLAGVEILLMAMEGNSSLVRSHIVEQVKFKSDRGFFDAVISSFLVENDPNIMPQLAEVIRGLVDIDPESSDENSLGFLSGGLMSVESSSRLDPDAEQFLELFYTQYCSTLVAPILQLMRTSTTLDRTTSARCANICKLMSFLVQQHPTRTKVLLSSSRLVEKIGILLKNRQKHMRLMALKFFRTCLGVEDDYFNRILIKNKIIHGIVGLLEETNGKNDLLNSVCLEFFSFIREKSNKLLVSHCATIHRKALEKIEYTPIFKDLLALHVGGGTSSSSSNNTTNGGGAGAPGSSTKPLWGSQSRLFPGMQVPLFSSNNNQDTADTGVKTFLSNPFRHNLENTDIDGAGASSVGGGVSGGVSSGPRLRVDNSTDSESSISLSPLPPVALRAGIVFLRADESRDGSSEHVADTNSERDTSTASEHAANFNSDATRLVPEVVTRTGDNGAEFELKRKRDEDDESDPGVTGAPAQQRPKLDATEFDSVRVTSAASEHLANSDLDATQLVPEVATGTGDNGAESELKRKWDENDESDAGVTDVPARQRPKLDSMEFEGVGRSVVKSQEHTPIALENTNHSTDINNNPLDDSDTAAVNHNVSNIGNGALTEDMELL